MQGGLEAVLVGFGLAREHVDGGAGEVAGAQRVGQRREIDDGAAAVVDQVGAPLHGGEFGRTHHAGGLRRVGHVEADDIAGGEQGAEAAGGFGVAVAELVGAVMIEDAHAEGFGEGGELGADVAVADDAERLAAHFAGADGGFDPSAGMGGVGAGKDLAHEHDDLADDEFGDGAGVAEGRVEHGQAGVAGGGEVDLVGADGEASDGEQAAAGRGEGGRIELGAGADAEEVDAAGEGVGKGGAVHGAGQAGDVEAAAAHEIDGAVADAFEQEGAQGVVEIGHLGSGG